MSTQKLVKEAVARHGTQREALISVLNDVVKQERYLSEDAIRFVAEEFKISAAQVYGTASFYSFLPTKPVGKNVIRICKTIVCDTAGKEEIISAIERKLGVKLGETTPDKNFTLLETNCLGQCDKGPAMLINDKIYVQLTAQKAVEALDEYFN